MSMGSIVGDVPLRVPIAGRIRPGFKRLTKPAREHAEVVKVYEDGLNKGQSFDEIAKRIEDETQYKKIALVPENAPHFTIRRGEFVNPKVADLIIEKYGETRPSHPNEKRVYSLPIILATDSWLDTLPHTLNVFNASGRVYWAEYQADGSRVCKTYGAPPPPQPKADRRLFGGRPIILRKENDGACNPDVCPQWHAKECQLKGAFRFYVAGIPGIAMVEIPTTSFYSLTGARDMLAMLTAQRGRIAGLQNGKPVLWVSKRREKVARYRPELGRSVPELQWLIRLESPEFDVATLIEQRESTINSVPRLVAPPPQISQEAHQEQLVLPADAVDGVMLPASTSTQEASAASIATKAAPEGPEGLADDLDAAMEKLGKVIASTGVDKAVALDYCASRFGKGWSKQLPMVKELLDDLKQFEDDPQALAAMLRQEEVPT